MRRRYEVYAAVMGHIRDVPEYQGAFEAEVRGEPLAHMARSGATSVEDILALIADEEGRSFDRLLRRLRKRHTRHGGSITLADDVENARKRTALPKDRPASAAEKFRRDRHAAVQKALRPADSHEHGRIRRREGARGAAMSRGGSPFSPLPAPKKRKKGKKKRKKILSGVDR
jgi:hypothetical protein